MLSEALVVHYLDNHKVCLAKTSKRSIKHTLSSLLPILDGNPARLWNHLVLVGQSPLTRISTWSRVCVFWDYYLKEEAKHEGPNPYRQFQRDNAGSFRNKYTKKVPQIGLKEARALIEKEVDDPALRKKALQLLLSGMRYSESFTYSNGQITGKGGLKRAAFLPSIEGPEYTGSYQNFIKKLKHATGLKPHDLRKIYLNHFLGLGANVFELKAIAGWTNIRTAEHYIQVSTTRLETLSKALLKESCA